MGPIGEPHSVPSQDVHERTEKQSITNIINDLTHIVMSKTLEDQRKDVGILVTCLQHKMVLQEMNSLPRDALKALKVTLKALQTKLPPDTHHEIVTGISNLNSYLKGAIAREVIVVTNDSHQVKVDPESLRLRSEYFRMVLSDRFREGTELKLNFDGTAEEFNELYLLCKFDEKELSKYISSDNVELYFILADKYIIPSLHNAIVNWITDHLDDLDLHDAVGLVKEYAPNDQERLAKWVAKRCADAHHALRSETTQHKKSPNAATLLDQAIELDLPEWAPICTKYLTFTGIQHYRDLAKLKGSNEIEKWCNFVISDANIYHKKRLPYPYELTEGGIKVDLRWLIKRCHNNPQLYRELYTWPLNERSIKAFPSIAVSLYSGDTALMPAIIESIPEYVTGIEADLCASSDTTNLIGLFDKLPNLSRLACTFYYPQDLIASAVSEVLCSKSHLGGLTELCFNFTPLTLNDPDPYKTTVLSIPILQANIHKSITRLEIHENIFSQYREFFAELHNYPDLTFLSLGTTSTADDLVKVITKLTLLPSWVKKVELDHPAPFYKIDKKDEVIQKDIIAHVIDSVNESRKAMDYPPIEIDIPNAEWRSYQAFCKSRRRHPAP